MALLALARAALSLRLAQRAGGSRQGAAWEWLLGEALLLAGFVRALGRRTVEWRGRRFALARGGRMQPLFDPISPWSGS